MNSDSASWHRKEECKKEIEMHKMNEDVTKLTLIGLSSATNFHTNRVPSAKEANITKFLQ
jgi:hypothetical protein